MKINVSKITLLILILLSVAPTKAQINNDLANRAELRKDERTRFYITPKRIVWQSDSTGKYVKNPEVVLKKGFGQAQTTPSENFVLTSDKDHRAGILLDFGKELTGGIQIVINSKSKNAKLRIRFGESVSEAMSNIGEKNATNDHALRDFETSLTNLSTLELGTSGFRFVRIDKLDTIGVVNIREISAIQVIRDIPYKGTFHSNNERLNKIWEVGAYTVHLNMQEYLLDGIKRDRLVWMGDMNPEIMTINSVFGDNNVVPKSMDFCKEAFPVPRYMNNIPSYSIWWIISQRDYYRYQGNLAYLKEQKTYLFDLLNFLMAKVDNTGSETLGGNRFIDWPNVENQPGVHAGLQALMYTGMEVGAELCTYLNEPEMAEKCKATALKLKQHVPSPNNSKYAAALMDLSEIAPNRNFYKEVLVEKPTENLSTFMGYYVLKSFAKAGDYQIGMNIIKDFWGGMLDMGATTFWEDFDIKWMENAAPIDQLVPAGKKDIHGDFGGFAYKKFRHSLAHGWASGPTAWLSQYVLGVNVIEPGCKVIRIEPHLGDLTDVEGTFPTPIGIVSIHHQKMKNGKIKTSYTAPKGVKVILKN